MKAKKFALYFDLFVLRQKRKYVKLLVLGFYVLLLCAPRYKNVEFYSDPPHPESSNLTKKSCRQKRVPTSTYVNKFRSFFPLNRLHLDPFLSLTTPEIVPISCLLLPKLST